jgi:hypothetical protein
MNIYIYQLYIHSIHGVYKPTFTSPRAPQRHQGLIQNLKCNTDYEVRVAAICQAGRQMATELGQSHIDG